MFLGELLRGWERSSGVLSSVLANLYSSVREYGSQMMAEIASHWHDHLNLC
jgi:hypothetical protein